MRGSALTKREPRASTLRFLHFRPKSKGNAESPSPEPLFCNCDRGLPECQPGTFPIGNVAHSFACSVEGKDGNFWYANDSIETSVATHHGRNGQFLNALDHGTFNRCSGIGASASHTQTGWHSYLDNRRDAQNRRHADRLWRLPFIGVPMPTAVRPIPGKPIMAMSILATATSSPPSPSSVGRQEAVCPCPSRWLTTARASITANWVTNGRIASICSWSPTTTAMPSTGAMISPTASSRTLMAASPLLWAFTMCWCRTWMAPSPLPDPTRSSITSRPTSTVTPSPIKTAM